MPNHEMKLKSCFFWHILFLDALVLHLRFGGMSVKDLLFHGVCLCLATALLAAHRKTYPVPKPYLIIFGSVLALVFIQLIPLPGFLFPILAPVKHRVLTVVDSIYPTVDASSQIAILPGMLHMKLVTLVLDMALILLAIMGPKPNGRIFRFWLVFISLTTASLAVVTSWDGAHRSELGGIYKGTSGGLVNPNNFAALDNILLAFLFCQVILSVRAMIKRWRDEENRSRKLLEQVLLGAFYGFCYLHVLYGFLTIHSRSGVIGFALTHLLISSFFLFEWNRSRTRIFTKKRVFIGSGVLAMIIVIVSLMPVHQGLSAIRDEGFESKGRVNYLKIGVNYLGEFPVLGVGLGAAESILEVVQPKTYEQKNARHFHNEYLQIAVELGLVGIIALIAFIIFTMLRLTGGFHLESFKQRSYFHALIPSLIFLILLCNISFPLRVTSIRVLVILLVFIGVKLAGEERRRSGRKWMVMTGASLAACMLWLVPAAFHQPESADLPTVARAVQYGRFFKVPFFESNQKLSDLLRSGNPDQAVMDDIDRIMYRSLDQNPFNTKALNVLFITETLRDRLANPEYNEANYRALRHKAQIINDLGEGANINAQSAFLFLFGVYADHLSPEDNAFYTELKETYRLNLRIVEKRLINEQKEADKQEQ